jgi:hypothetical protein
MSRVQSSMESLWVSSHTSALHASALPLGAGALQRSTSHTPPILVVICGPSSERRAQQPPVPQEETLCGATHSYVRTAFGSPTPEEFDKMVEEKAQLQAKVEEQAAMIEQLNAKVCTFTTEMV